MKAFANLYPTVSVPGVSPVRRGASKADEVSTPQCPSTSGQVTEARFKGASKTDGTVRPVTQQPADLWSRYVTTVAGSHEQTAIASRTGVSQGTVSRWLSRRYTPDKAAPVVAFARGYNRPVLEALVAAGMITIEDTTALPTENVQFIEALRAPST